MLEHFYEFWLAGTDTLPNANLIVDFLEPVAFGDAWIERLVCVICATWGPKMTFATGTIVPAGATTGFVAVTMANGTLKSNLRFRVR